jgi:hypothetical protein
VVDGEPVSAIERMILSAFDRSFQNIIVERKMTQLQRHGEILNESVPVDR